MASKSDIIIYQTQKGDTKIDILVKEETVWINRKTMHVSKWIVKLHGFFNAK